MDEEKGRLHEEGEAFLGAEEKENHGETASIAISKPAGLSYRFWISAVVNTVCTAAIVFINKRIFDHAALRHAQVAFAAFHFSITALVLYILSRPRIGVFQTKRAPIRLILPIALAMIFNVVLSNAALAWSSIQFYQVSRVLVTPCIVALNYVVYQTNIPTPAALTLVLVCVGVGVLSYFDTQPTSGEKAKDTTYLGVAFAFGGVFSTAVYTVWIKTYHGLLECNSWQLLFNQAPVSVLIMLYVIPFSDDVTAWRSLDMPLWVLIGISGVLACSINLSQFILIDEAGAVSSSVVGHFKTCSIVLLSWIMSRKTLTNGSLVGVALALGGIISYTYVTLRKK